MSLVLYIRIFDERIRDYTYDKTNVDQLDQTLRETAKGYTSIFSDIDLVMVWFLKLTCIGSYHENWFREFWFDNENINFHILDIDNNYETIHPSFCISNNDVRQARILFGFFRRNNMFNDIFKKYDIPIEEGIIQFADETGEQNITNNDEFKACCSVDISDCYLMVFELFLDIIREYTFIASSIVS